MIFDCIFPKSTFDCKFPNISKVSNNSVYLICSRRQHRIDSDIRTILNQPPKKATSNQINQARRKNQTDYENLLLLQKIQNAKPSNTIYKSFSTTRRFWINHNNSTLFNGREKKIVRSVCLRVKFSFFALKRGGILSRAKPKWRPSEARWNEGKARDRIPPRVRAKILNFSRKWTDFTMSFHGHWT